MIHNYQAKSMQKCKEYVFYYYKWICSFIIPIGTQEVNKGFWN